MFTKKPAMCTERLTESPKELFLATWLIYLTTSAHSGVFFIKNRTVLPIVCFSHDNHTIFIRFSYEAFTKKKKNRTILSGNIVYFSRTIDRRHGREAFSLFISI